MKSVKSGSGVEIGDKEIEDMADVEKDGETSKSVKKIGRKPKAKTTDGYEKVGYSFHRHV